MSAEILAQPRSARPAGDDAPIDAAIVRQAACWFVKLHSGTATAADRAACEKWHRADPEHARAWHRLTAMSRPFQQAAANVAPQVARNTLRTAAVSLKRRQSLKALAWIGAAGSAVWLARESAPWLDGMTVVQTGTGERRTVALADGSRLMLNTATRVEIAFGAERRRIDLRNGEIMLATARDTLQRPFVVDTADGTLTPIGTRFTVRSGDFAEDGTRVAVLDGAVEVRTRDNASTPLVVRAGEQRMFTHSAIQAVAALADNAVSWTQGSLGAERTRLADFLAELGRYRRGHLGCDPDVADLRLTGAFPLDDTDRILAALEDALPVKVRYLTRYWVTLTRAG